jgi:hypothetical protein
MKRHPATLLVLIVCLPGAGAAWYFWINFRPLNENDYTTVVGTLRSIEPGGTGKSPHLDIYTLESPVRFRVLSDCLENAFDKESFEHRTHPAGTRIKLKVEKTQLAKPSRPPMDPKETVYVYGMRDDRVEYSTLNGYEKWREQDRVYALVLAVCLTGVALTIVGISIVSLAANAAPTSAAGAAALREESLSRVYRHTGCGGQTVISGDDYVNLECPFRPVQGTYCCACQQFVPLSMLQWSDTGENVAEYRRQLYDSVPYMRRVWLTWFGSRYEGALNLRLDKHGLPILPAADSTDQDQLRHR